MALVAGIDSSTQACKVVVRDADSGDLVRQGRAAHPDGTEVDPARWWAAAQEAIEAAGGLDDVAAVAVGAQQHGLVCLDSAGEVVRPALLWNDTRSASSAADLVDELGGGRRGRTRWAWCRWRPSPPRSCVGSPTMSPTPPTAPPRCACRTTG